MTTTKPHQATCPPDCGHDLWPTIRAEAAAFAAQLDAIDAACKAAAAPFMPPADSAINVVDYATDSSGTSTFAYVMADAVVYLIAPPPDSGIWYAQWVTKDEVEGYGQSMFSRDALASALAGFPDRELAVNIATALDTRRGEHVWRGEITPASIERQHAEAKLWDRARLYELWVPDAFVWQAQDDEWRLSGHTVEGDDDDARVENLRRGGRCEACEELDYGPCAPECPIGGVEAQAIAEAAERVLTVEPSGIADHVIDSWSSAVYASATAGHSHVYGDQTHPGDFYTCTEATCAHHRALQLISYREGERLRQARMRR